MCERDILLIPDTVRLFSGVTAGMKHRSSRSPFTETPCTLATAITLRRCSDLQQQQQGEASAHTNNQNKTGVLEHRFFS